MGWLRRLGKAVAQLDKGFAERADASESTGVGSHSSGRTSLSDGLPNDWGERQFQRILDSSLNNRDNKDT